MMILARLYRTPWEGFTKTISDGEACRPATSDDEVITVKKFWCFVSRFCVQGRARKRD
jgi:hypothetical protein